MNIKQKANEKWRVGSLVLLLVVIVIISIPLSTILGSSDIALHQVWDVYKEAIGLPNHAEIEAPVRTIIWDLRFPRALLAIFVGAGLAMSGCAMQAVTKNVMAEPYTLGVASGASLFAAFSIAFLRSYRLPLELGVSGFAFLGALLAMFTVFKLAAGNTVGRSTNRLILSGVAISIFCNAVLQLIISAVRSEAKLRGIIYWTMGSLGAARWFGLLPPLIAAGLGFIILFACSETLNLMSLGSETAVSLGVNIQVFQRRIIATISLVTAVMVSASGCIGFVGLVIPHVSRKLVGADHRNLLPIASLIGSLALLWADAFSRIIIAPEELSVGVLTALVGVPFFLFLLRKGEQIV